MSNNLKEQGCCMSILKILEDNNVFGILNNADGTFKVFEMCDQYFDLELTANEMMELSREIMDMAVERKELEDVRN